MTGSQTATFLGGLDKDTTHRFVDVAKGDYVLAENVRTVFSQGGNDGCVENFRGTLRIENGAISDDSGRFVSIFTCQDNANNRVFYFVCDTEGLDHAIYLFDATDDTIKTLYRSSSLAFSVTDRVHSAFVINNMLFWADNKNPPRKVNIKNALAGDYSAFLPEYIDQIKNPPSVPIEVSTPLFDGPDFTLGRSFQFRYRYVYSEGETSVWAMPSRLYSSGYRDINSGVTLTIDNPELKRASVYSKIISFIEISVRDADEASWRFYKRIPFPVIDNSIISDTFLNDRAYRVIDPIEANKLEDSVPLSSGALAYIENRIVHGKIVAGRNIPVISVTNLGASEVAPIRDRMYLKSGGRYGIGIVLFDAGGRATGVIQRQDLNIAQPNRNGAFKPTKTSFAIGGECPGWVAYLAIVITKARNKRKFVQAFVTTSDQTNEHIKFDANFISPTNSGVVWEYSVGDRCSILTKNSSGDSLNRPQFDLALDYDPVSAKYTAKWYGQGMDSISSGALVEFYTPSESSEVEYYWEICKTYAPVVDAMGVRRYGNTHEGNSLLINIGDGVDGGDIHYRLPSPETGKPSGVRASAVFICLDSAVATAYQVIARGVTLTSSPYTSGVDAATWFISQTISGCTISAGSSSSEMIITSTTIGADPLFVTPTFSGNIVMPTFLDSATAATNNAGVSIEAMHANDLYFENWQHNIGRARIASDSEEKQLEDTSLLIASDAYIQGSNINGLCSVNIFNQKQLPVAFGAISAIKIAADQKITGAIMLVITVYEIVAFYINKQQYTDTSGSTQLGISESFFGSYNLLQGGYGTSNPESVVAYAGRVYGWDIIKGVIWRYSQDGLTAISRIYGLRTFVGNIGKKITKNRSNPLQTAVASFDPYYEEYLLALKDIDSNTAIVISFNEAKNQFNATWSFSPDCMGYINQRLLSWKNGQMYVHWEGSRFNQIYNETLKSKVGVVFNDSWQINKLLLSLKIQSDDKWTSVRITQHHTTDGRQQITSSASSEVVQREWDWITDVKKAAPDKINGNSMRGKSFYVELELSHVDYLTSLVAVIAKYSISNPEE